jgi:hypothetical protein
MKTIIAGSRTIIDYDIVEKAILDSGFNITQVISGMAKGVDTLGELWAIKNNKRIIQCPADWNKNGKMAGYMRNIEMANIADALIVIIENNSRGSSHMSVIARDRGLHIHEHHINNKK